MAIQITFSWLTDIAYTNHNDRINLKGLNESGREDPENAISDDLETQNFQNVSMVEPRGSRPPLTFTNFLRP